MSLVIALSSWHGKRETKKKDLHESLDWWTRPDLNGWPCGCPECLQDHESRRELESHALPLRHASFWIRKYLEILVAWQMWTAIDYVCQCLRLEAAALDACSIWGVVVVGVNESIKHLLYCSLTSFAGSGKCVCRTFLRCKCHQKPSHQLDAIYTRPITTRCLQVWEALENAPTNSHRLATASIAYSWLWYDTCLMLAI